MRQTGRQTITYLSPWCSPQEDYGTMASTWHLAHNIFYRVYHNIAAATLLFLRVSVSTLCRQLAPELPARPAIPTLSPHFNTATPHFYQSSLITCAWISQNVLFCLSGLFLLVCFCPNHTKQMPHCWYQAGRQYSSAFQRKRQLIRAGPSNCLSTWWFSDGGHS